MVGKLLEDLYRYEREWLYFEQQTITAITKEEETAKKLQRTQEEQIDLQQQLHACKTTIETTANMQKMEILSLKVSIYIYIYTCTCTYSYIISLSLYLHLSISFFSLSLFLSLF